MILFFLFFAPLSSYAMSCFFPKTAEKQIAEGTTEQDTKIMSAQEYTDSISRMVFSFKHFFSELADYKDANIEEAIDDPETIANFSLLFSNYAGLYKQGRVRQFGKKDADYFKQWKINIASYSPENRNMFFNAQVGEKVFANILEFGPKRVAEKLNEKRKIELAAQPISTGTFPFLSESDHLLLMEYEARWKEAKKLWDNYYTATQNIDIK